MIKKIDNIKKHKREALIGAIIGLNAIIPNAKAQQTTNKDSLSTKQQTETIKDSLQSNNTVSFTEVTKNPFYKKYDINSLENMLELYEASLPSLELGLISVEGFISHYKSGGIGIGNFMLPADGVYTSSKWITTRSYIAKHPKTTIDLGQAINLVDGWFRYMSNGATIKKIYGLLKGASLTPNEFTAIAMIYYQSPSSGEKVCQYIQKNYKNPTACAKYIMNMKNADRFPKRYLPTMLIYLNIGDITTSLQNLELNQKSLVAFNSYFNGIKKELEDNKFDIAHKVVKQMKNTHETLQHRIGLPFSEYMNDLDKENSTKIIQKFAKNKIQSGKDTSEKQYKNEINKLPVLKQDTVQSNKIKPVIKETTKSTILLTSSGKHKIKEPSRFPKKKTIKHNKNDFALKPKDLMALLEKRNKTYK